jgi:hypothetical protein
LRGLVSSCCNVFLCRRNGVRGLTRNSHNLFRVAKKKKRPPASPLGWSGAKRTESDSPWQMNRENWAHHIACVGMRGASPSPPRLPEKDPHVFMWAGGNVGGKRFRCARARATSHGGPHTRTHTLPRAHATTCAAASQPASQSQCNEDHQMSTRPS